MSRNYRLVCEKNNVFDDVADGNRVYIHGFSLNQTKIDSIEINVSKSAIITFPDINYTIQIKNVIVRTGFIHLQNQILDFSRFPILIPSKTAYSISLTNNCGFSVNLEFKVNFKKPIKKRKMNYNDLDTHYPSKLDTIFDFVKGKDKYLAQPIKMKKENKEIIGMDTDSIITKPIKQIELDKERKETETITEFKILGFVFFRRQKRYYHKRNYHD